jgi:hypothetical protein
MYPPPTGGNQPPYNNQPQFNNQPQNVPPGGYINPNQKRPGAGGCWLWGGLGCLGIFLIVAAVIAYSTYSLVHGKFGTSVTSMASTTIKAKKVEDAINQYKRDTGHYPDNLTDLIPKYLPNQSALHGDSDPNPDPNHVTFEYTKPADNASGKTVMLSYHTPMDMNIMGAKAHIDTKINYNVDGSESRDATQTTTTADGKSSTTTTHTDVPSGSDSSGSPSSP